MSRAHRIATTLALSLGLSLSLACDGGTASLADPGADAPAPSQAPSFELPEGYMTLEDSREILAQTLTIELAPDISGLTDGERRCLQHLIEVGGVFQALYEDARHPESSAALEALRQLDRAHGSPEATQNLETLHWLFRGPMATTPGGDRVAIYPIDPPPVGGGVYPPDASREELAGFIDANPELESELLHPRMVVRREGVERARADLEALRRFPALDGKHPGLRARLEKIAASPDPSRFYALPYSVAWPDELMRASEGLEAAAAAVEADDAQFAQYLRARANDLLIDDYEDGDRAWVQGQFERLNAQIGSYETYDDNLFGTKTFFSLSILIRDQAATRELAALTKDLQSFEDSLPYDRHKKVRSNIPVGVYRIIADFGQARGGNTASILPNEARIVRKYGRTILLRANIMRNEALFERSRPQWLAAVGQEQGAWLTPDGNFQRTLWHEIGHYLGVDQDRKGRPLSIALEHHNNTLEEMKADLVSLHVAHLLHERGKMSDDQLRSIQAAGIRRTLQKSQPAATQPYQVMQLMQMNYFLEHGLLDHDETTGQLVIHRERYAKVVRDLLAEVLAIQRLGEVERAQEFIDRHTIWKQDLHAELAERMVAERSHRYTLYRYAALD